MYESQQIGRRRMRNSFNEEFIRFHTVELISISGFNNAVNIFNEIRNVRARRVAMTNHGTKTFNILFVIIQHYDRNKNAYSIIQIDCAYLNRILDGVRQFE